MGAINAEFPKWLKLAGQEKRFTAYISGDGTKWTQVGGAVSVSIGASVNIGLAVSSMRNGTLETATFDNVVIATTP